MISLDLDNVCLIELLKASLFDTKPEIPNETNWERVFEAAKKQCIIPLLISGVPTKYRDEWFKKSCQSKAYFMQLIHEQNLLVNLFINNGIPFIIFKGTAAAIYYPNPSFRTFGDIDFYVTNEHFDAAKCLLLNNGYSFVSNNERHYIFVKNGIEYELHKRISSKHYNDIEDIILSVVNNSVEYRISGFPFPGLPTYHNGLVLLGHIMQHLKTSGIGLRQIIDWMMFVHKELDDVAWEKYFRPLASSAGLEKLAITVTFMCRKWLGLPNNITWCNSADEAVADQLLVRILDEGNLGHDRALYENVRKSMKKEGVFTVIQSSGIENWHLAQKCVIFRPFAWIYQLGRYICIGIISLFKGKKVFRKEKKNMSLEELWKKLE